MTMKNKFIVVDGLDGSGKTSVVIPTLEEFLKTKGHDVIVLGSYTSNQVAISIKKVLDEQHSTLSNTERAMYSNMARTAVSYDIKDALSQNKTVIIDRWLYSEIAYNDDYENDKTIQDIVNGSDNGLVVDYVIFCDCDFETATQRIKLRENNDELDKFSRETYEKRRNRYINFFNKSDNDKLKNVIILDCRNDISTVRQDCYNIVNEICKE